MSNRTRNKALAAIFAVTTGALVLIAAPAQADSPRNDTRACWIDTSSAVTRCFTDEAELREAVADSGRYLVEENSALAGRPPAGALAVYVIARLYQHASYGGSTSLVTHSSSTICATSSVSGNLPTFNDVTSSFRSYFGCSTKIFANNGQTGASYGWFVDASSVGALNDLASSYNVT